MISRFSSVFVLSILGCSEPEVIAIPKYVIPRDSMPLVIAEMHIYNATSQHRESRKMKFQHLAVQDKNEFLDSLRISNARFDSSLSFYLNQPQEMELIYDEAMNLLSERLAKLPPTPKDTTVVKPKSERIPSGFEVNNPMRQQNRLPKGKPAINEITEKPKD